MQRTVTIVASSEAGQPNFKAALPQPESPYPLAPSFAAEGFPSARSIEAGFQISSCALADSCRGDDRKNPPPQSRHLSRCRSGLGALPQLGRGWVRTL